MNRVLTKNEGRHPKKFVRKWCCYWGAASWGVGAVDGGSVNAFLAASLTRVMRASVPIPALASASVLQSAAVGGSVVGVVGPL